MKPYDYLLVGSGLFSAVFANEARRAGKTVMVVERRNHIAGNCYTKEVEGITVHEYGAHIFRASDKKIWDYLEQFSPFNNFINSPIANYHGEIYNLPFNMNTFSRMWNISTPDEARAIIAEQQKEITGDPKNLEEQAIKLVGRDVYEKLIKGYTEKQWGRPCSQLPAFIIKRIPVRFLYDNNYFNDPYQGIPIEGYTAIIQKMFDGCELHFECDYLDNKDELYDAADTIVFTGTIDSFYDYRFDPLEYRSLRFEHKTLDEQNHQGVAVVNYTDSSTPFTRIIEHKHFEFGTQPKTVISREYPLEWSPGIEPYYPINDEANQNRFSQYRALADEETKVRFGGRLGEYRYYDMQSTVQSALQLASGING